ncbi:MAG: poly-gamma-glutamate system protein [Myxococcales bacterium]|nr:poly-gamma-glutamate system protein [Myxococcales bacterium]
MKKIYWRPPSVSRRALALIAAVALIGLSLVETFPQERKQSFHKEKLAAAQLARTAMGRIKEEKQRRGITIDRESDPAGTGLIGHAVTPVTSNTGYIESKQTSTNPNFAAVVVHLLKRAGVENGDVVAVGLSGSFPGLNASTYAALEVLKAKAIVIASAASSEWGANDVELMWLDMEQVLFDAKLISFRATAASRGGIDDRGFGLSPEGRHLIDALIERRGIHKLTPKNLTDSVDQRMQIYRDQAGDRPIKAYINIGGGAASTGTHVGKKLFKPGLNTDVPYGAIDSVMLRFAQDGVPVIHLSNVKVIAERYGLPIAPQEPPQVGVSRVFVRAEYDERLVVGVILAVGLAMFAFLRLDVGLRILGRRRESSHAHPQRMV